MKVLTKHFGRTSFFLNMYSLQYVLEDEATIGISLGRYIAFEGAHAHGFVWCFSIDLLFIGIAIQYTQNTRKSIVYHKKGMSETNE